MPLQKSAPIDVPFATGLSQKADSRLLQMGAQTSLTNGVIDKAGTISKRPGTTLLASTAVSASGNQVGQTTYRQRIFKDGPGGIGLLSGRRYWKRATAINAWSDIDDVRAVQAQRFGLATPTDSVTSYDVAVYSSGAASYAAVAYCEASVCKLMLFDLNTNTVIYGPVTVDSTNAGDECRVCMTNGTIVVAYQSSAAVATIRAKAFSVTAWTFTAAVSLAVDCGFRGMFDLMAMSGGTNCVLGYITNSGANAGNLCVKLVSSAPAVTATQVYAGTTGGGGFTQGRGVAIHATSGEQIWVANAYDDGVNTYVRARGLNPTTLATTVVDGQVWSEVATQYYRLGIERETSTACWVTGSLYAGATSFYASRMQTIGPSGLTVQMRGYGIASKPFTMDGRICVTVVQTVMPSTAPSATYLVVDLVDGPSPTPTTYYPPRPIATVGPRIVTPNQCSLYVTSSAAMVGTTRCVAIGSIERAASGGTGLDLIDVQLSYAANQTAQLGDVVYCAGGTPQELDGTTAVECGFMHPPRTASATAIAGGAMAVGNYYYAAVFEYRDDRGQRSQSSPLFFGPATTAGANLQVSVVVGCLHVTQRQNAARQRLVSVALYRTAVGALASGVYYRVWTGAVPATAQSSTLNATITYTDSAVDSSLAGNEILNTALLTPACPSSLSCLIAHNGRLVGVSDDGITLQWSTKFDGGTTVPYFSDDLLTYCAEGGRITALASMDGQLIIFKRDSIFLVSGDGPDTNGNGSTWSDPRRIASDVGCTSDWRGVLAMPMGVVFQSEKKLHLLTRGLEVQYLSQPVEDTLASYPSVQFACLHSRRDEVRFGVTTADGATAGYVINWNYVTNCWSILDYWDNNRSALHANFVTAASIDGVWYGVTWQGQTQQENVDLTATGAYKDDANWVTLSVESAWIKAAGIQGWGRFWRVYTSMINQAPHDLSISVGQDYGGYTQTKTWTASQIAAWTTPIEDSQVQVVRQKASAIRVMLSDATPTGVASTTGAGPRLLGIALEVGLYSGGKRLPDAQRA